MNSSSYKTILRSSSIIGGSQVFNILGGLIRLKIVAVLIGPAGLGLIGLYTSIIQTAASIAGLGISNVGTRQIATAFANGGAEEVGRTRRILFWGAVILATLGTGVFWWFRTSLARIVLGDPGKETDVAWLALGVALSIGVVAQVAVLTGMRRIGDLARISVIASTLSTVANAVMLGVWGARGLIAIVLAQPLITFLIGYIFVSRLEKPEGPRLHLRDMAYEWISMARLGFAFMLSGLVTTLGGLAIRMLVQHHLGTAALGQFQAAWVIGMTYLGVVLAAMGTDYFPRLSGVITDRQAATRLVNEQTEVALLLGGPIVLMMLGFAPWLISMLYTQTFGAAVDVLRWQLLGDILKLMSWPLGFVIIAAAAGKTFVIVEALGMAVLVVGTYAGLSNFGVTATGIAFLGMYVAYLPLVRWVGGRLIGFRWSPSVQRQAVVIIMAAVCVDIVGRLNALVGAGLGTLTATAMGVWAVARLAKMTQAEGRLGRLVRYTERIRQLL